MESAGRKNPAHGKHHAVRPGLNDHMRSWLTDRPRPMHILVIVICVVLGFALSTQVRARDADPLARLSEDELVSLLSDLDRREEELRRARTDMELQIASLEDAATSAQAAKDAADRAATDALIISGAIPVEGPGIVYRVTPGTESIPASVFVGALAELRNAGAEAIALNGVRLSGRSWFGELQGTVILDGTPLQGPYIWTVIGEPHTLGEALAIRGGTTAQFRAYNATTSVSESDSLSITEVTQPIEPQWAQVDEGQ